jgi:para-aminobenzoate synthetase component 1
MIGTELPLVERLATVPDVEAVFSRYAQLPHCLFLDSARRGTPLGRYSFLAADPFAWLTAPADGRDALSPLAVAMQQFSATPVASLPPFQGGAAGLFSYDLGRSLEQLPRPRYEEFDVPALGIGLYDVVLAIDHHSNAAYLISQGFPERDPAARHARAAHRLAKFRELIESPNPSGATAGLPSSAAPHVDAAVRLPNEQLAPQFALPGWDALTSNFTRAGYLQAVAQAIEYIRAGDVFQVNLSQRLLHPANSDAVSLYLRLRQRNPATFAGYFDLGDYQLCSASPERFLQLRNGTVEARPIKGTRRRAWPGEADLFAGDDLLASEKDRAENVMIVDLLRNDLSRVCLPDSVKVTELCRLELYEFVQHLVSAVEGTLPTSATPVDLLRAAFPGGSITGAPKIRAMQIIAELEPTARGAYCGSLGYWGFDGSMDTNILIRTITAGKGWWQAPVGGGIVSQSVPEREYEETWIKAEGLLRAFF